MKYSYLVEFESEKESVSEFLSQVMNGMIDNARETLGIKAGHCWLQKQPCKSNWGSQKTDTQQLKDSISLLNEAVNVQDCTCTLKTEPCWMCRALEQIAKLKSV